VKSGHAVIVGSPSDAQAFMASMPSKLSSHTVPHSDHQFGRTSSSPVVVVELAHARPMRYCHHEPVIVALEYQSLRHVTPASINPAARVMQDEEIVVELLHVER
jgi:hypothetical protein